MDFLFPLLVSVAQVATDIGTYLTIILPLITGLLSTVIFDGLKTISAKVDALPVTLKKIVSSTLSFVIGFLAIKLGIAPDALNLDQPYGAEVINGILTAFAAAGIFRWQQRKQVAPAP